MVDNLKIKMIFSFEKWVLLTRMFGYNQSELFFLYWFVFVSNQISASFYGILV